MNKSVQMFDCFLFGMNPSYFKPNTTKYVLGFKIHVYVVLKVNSIFERHRCSTSHTSSKVVQWSYRLVMLQLCPVFTTSDVGKKFNKDVTLKETLVSPGARLKCRIFEIKSVEFYMLYGVFSNSGVKMLLLQDIVKYCV